jgi:hypothetical protein
VGKSRRLLVVPLSALALVVSTGAVTGGGAALAADPAPRIVTAHIDGATIKQALATQSKLRSVAGDKVAAAKSEHLKSQARSNRLLDTAAVEAVVVPNPLGGDLSIAWDGARMPESVDLRQAQFNDGSVDDAMKMTLAPEPAAETKAPALGSAAGGFGFSAGVNPNGMYRYNGSCQTVTWNPSYVATSSDPNRRKHHAGTCFEKWAKSGTNRWIYNHWSDFLQAQSTSNLDYAKTVDYTIRSRPYKGQESKVLRMTNYTIPSSSSNCTDIGTVNLTVSGGGVSIPLHKCNKTTVTAYSSTKELAMDWSGSTTGQLYLDEALAFDASNSSVVPVFADYVWAEVQYCEDTDCLVQNYHSDIAAWKESGW